MSNKKHSIKILESADLDMEEAVFWYKNIDFDLSLNFLMEYDKILDYLEDNSNLFIKTKSDFHEVKLKHFPYTVIYRIYDTEKIVVITSVFHQKRNPKNKNNF